MKTTTPVQIQEKYFPSINRARLYYTDILHKYDINQKLSSEDIYAISALRSAAPSEFGVVPLRHVTVVSGKFARPCFELTFEENQTPQRISMLRSIKQHVVRATKE